MKTRRCRPILPVLIAILVAVYAALPLEADAQARRDRSAGTDRTQSDEPASSPDATPNRREAREQSQRGTSTGTPEAAPAQREADRGRTSPSDRTTQSRDDRDRSDSRAGRDGANTSPAPAPAPDVRQRERSPDRRPAEQAPGRDVRQDQNRRQSNARTGRRPAYRWVPPVYVHPAWPWHWRHQVGWSPLFRYRQRVFIEVGWAGRRRDARLEVETVYRHQVGRTTSNRADIDIFIERISLYRDGRFIGEVARIPSSLGRIRAEVFRNGRMHFDRNVLLVGDERVGFELISTRHYDGYVLDAYQRSHGYRAGRLDFRRHRVVPVGRSRFFNPFRFDGYVPISLLPDDSRWLLDVGRESISGYYYDSNRSHGYDRYTPEERRYMEMDAYRVSPESFDAGYGQGYFQSDRASQFSEESGLLERRNETEIRTSGGAVIQFRREEAIEPFEAD